MEDGLRVEFEVHLENGQNGHRKLCRGAFPKNQIEPGNVPRISRLLALAHHLESLLRQGIVRDYADIARLRGVSRARVTQIMNLLLLAPDIQEEILFLPRTTKGSDPMSERSVRLVVAQPLWMTQRKLWQGLQ